MKTIIFDLDGTLCRLKTPLERSLVFLSRDMLEDLSSFQFALVTGGIREEAEYILEKAGVRDLFLDDLILTRDDSFGEKKTGEPFREILRRVNGKAIVVGDSEADRLGAEQAGLTCILVRKMIRDELQKEALQEAIETACQELR